ncbi:MAG: hypothetical protein AAGA46_03290 [Cyanobacteria bacterium P01_F01_bin.13]
MTIPPDTPNPFLGLSVAALMSMLFDLYKAAGAPYGDDHAGLERWMGEQFSRYEVFCGGGK